MDDEQPQERRPVTVASGQVDRVLAHALPGPNPSTGVLGSLDFVHTGSQQDAEVGTVWERSWELPREL